MTGNYKQPPGIPSRCLSCAQPMQLIRGTERFGVLRDLCTFQCRACGISLSRNAAGQREPHPILAWSRRPATSLRWCSSWAEIGTPTPPAVAARSSKMPKSSAPEFRIKDGSLLHSGECAQSLDVLIPARRRATRSRTHAHRPSCRRWRPQDWHPISRTQDPRCYLVNSCMAEPKTFDAKSIRRSHTGSRTEHGEPWLNKARLWANPAR
jgi:hypothetical protein